MSEDFEPLVEAARGGKDAVVATMQSTGTWDGVPRPGRYKIVPAPADTFVLPELFAAWGFPAVLDV